MMNKLVLASFLLSLSASVMSNNDMTKRLDFLTNEEMKINKIISQGSDSSQSEKYLSEILKEKKNLKKKIAELKSKEVVKKIKPAAIKKKVITLKKSKKKKIKRKNRKISHEVEIDRSKDLKTQLRDTLSLLDRENDHFVLINENDLGRRARRIASANIEYLEKEKMRLLEKLRASYKSNLSNFTYNGHFQFRNESAKNRQGLQGSRQSNESFYRLRTYMSFHPNERLTVNLTPQATKGLGEDSGGSSTSGSTKHTELFFFEANIDYSLSDNLTFKLGRQELSYGDHLIIGALPWANTGRSFDGLKFQYSYDIGKTDVMYSKISDNGTSLVSNDDANLITIYNSLSFGPRLKNVDFYIFHQDDNRIGGSELNTIGFRVKGKEGKVFYRTENALQNGANIGADAYQYNLEVGGEFKSYKASLEYAVAGADYIQMYPTAHKFLGFADVLGRRNLKQLAVHLNAAMMSWLDISLDYHVFKRNDTRQSAYKLLGAAWGINGASDDIGNEIDVVLTFKTKDRVKFQLGGAWFNPGEYMTAQNGNQDEATQFIYGQLNASF